MVNELDVLVKLDEINGYEGYVGLKAFNPFHWIKKHYQTQVLKQLLENSLDL